MLKEKSKHIGGVWGYEGARRRGIKRSKAGQQRDGLRDEGELSAAQFLWKCSFLSSCSLPCLMESHPSPTQLEFNLKYSRVRPLYKWRLGVGSRWRFKELEVCANAENIYIEKGGLKELVFGRFGQVFFVSLMFQTLICSQKIMDSKADRYLLP